MWKMDAAQGNQLRMPFAVEHVALTAASHARPSNARFDLFVMMEHHTQRRLRSSGNVVAPEGVIKKKMNMKFIEKTFNRRSIKVL